MLNDNWKFIVRVKSFDQNIAKYEANKIFGENSHYTNLIKVIKNVFQEIWKNNLMDINSILCIVAIHKIKPSRIFYTRLRQQKEIYHRKM